ncbi:lipase family protein [Variovorax sp. dw_954]|uniref:alpha/beta hydrolase family protein n=1 Tax=Variovorax sp. dw_954 TaxID=2720078 RepID=UPI001BD2E200|nr:lipase family protein [Variovorax sp. dw_954]
MKHFQMWSVAAAAAVLTACGGGGGGNAFLPIVAPTATAPAATTPETPAPSSLREPAMVATTFTAAQINGATSASGLQALSGKAKCDVKLVPIHYNTIGVKGEPANASGVLLLPAGACASTAAPLLAYARGTEVSKSRTMANPQDGETQLLLAMFAAQGYAVVATDYLGYARSTYAFHPYLHADSEASAVVDSLRAARLAATSQGALLSGKVMFTGYSQGGHSSMSAHRAAERDNAAEFNVVAAAHLAGPYYLSNTLRSTDAIAGYQIFVPFLVNSYQKVYGDVYANTSVVYQDAYTSAAYDTKFGSIADLLPSPTLSYTTLVTSGAVPGANGETPAQARDALFQPAFMSRVQTDKTSTLYLAAKKNDLLGWSPKASTLLCGGAGDPTVPPAAHMVPLMADFQARGVTTVTSLDVDSQIQATYGPGGAAPTDPASPDFAAYYGKYHGTYEPPFCLLAARTLFNTLK